MVRFYKNIKPNFKLTGFTFSTYTNVFSITGKLSSYRKNIQHTRYEKSNFDRSLNSRQTYAKKDIF